ncbi:hypothetical protein TIFTF001_035780 [Ficus carica]|uniref:Uncharacterized protein n=1 Tax=Ficus carica TaxID=3494 RepID=A0AA88E5H3_FICCA|nr:hypothetical protein TIFTF001_035780 [Ficus carica]
MNAFLKKDLEEDIPLWMFLRHCDNGLAALRYTEMNEHDKNTMTEPLLNQTNMPFVEEQAASIFTREILNQVKREIICVDQYVVNVQPDQLPDYDICKREGVVENTRYGGVSILVAFYATKSRAAFNKAMKVLSDLVMDLKEMAREQGDDPLSKNETTKEIPFEIKDPKPVQTKGRPVQFKASQSNFSQGKRQLRSFNIA